MAIHREFGVMDGEREEVEKVVVEMLPNGDVVMMQGENRIEFSVAMIYAMVWELK